MRPGFTPAEDVQRFRPRHLAQRDGDARSPRSPGGRSLADLVRMNESQGNDSPSQTRRTVRAPEVSTARADQVSTWKKAVPAESGSGRETKEWRTRGGHSTSARTTSKPSERLKVSAPAPEKPVKTTEPKLIPDTQSSKANAAADKRAQGTVPEPMREQPPQVISPLKKDKAVDDDTKPVGGAKATDGAKTSGDAAQISSSSRTDNAVDALQASMNKLSIERR